MGASAGRRSAAKQVSASAVDSPIWARRPLLLPLFAVGTLNSRQSVFS